MSVQLPQYIYQRDGFKLTCNQLVNESWTGHLEFDDGVSVDIDEEHVTHNAVFSTAKNLHGRRVYERKSNMV